ncbi:MAG: sugar ABC transporter ATP-binding protein [Spirochaetales bacterium]|nr:sugar ABC transporter ATP-binding protein [Spirochaetales bacterium]
MKELLRIRDLSTENSNEPRLNNFRLQVFSGEILGLVGLNGSGKSTLAGVLSGKSSIKSGLLYFQGVRYDLQTYKISRLQMEKQGVFVIKNENRLIQNLNISENMSISLKRRMGNLLGNPGKKEKLVELTLNEFFPELNPDMDAINLPLAVHWQIGILKAYIEGAQLIVLDRILEFCSGKEGRGLIRFIKILKKKGIGFIITYNKIASFLKVFDRLAVVRKGQLSGVIHHGDYDPELLASFIIGREYTDRLLVKKDEETVVGNKLFEVRNLSFGNSLRKINLKLYSGEILGIYDPVLEKSTALMNILGGISLAEEGLILVEDKLVEIYEEYHAVRFGIGVVSEKMFDKLFFKDLTVGKNLALSAAKRSSQLWGHISHSAEKYMENKYPPEIGIPENYSKIPVKLIDKDFQFILALHMRILSGAKIFLLENPIRGADLLTRKMIYQKIESLRKNGTGVIFISTDYTELDGFCDRIIQYDKIGLI